MKKNFHVRELGPYYRFMTFTKREIAEQSKLVCVAIEEEEKKKILLTKALIDGEESGFVQDFDPELLLKDLHSKHKG